MIHNTIRTQLDALNRIIKATANFADEKEFQERVGCHSSVYFGNQLQKASLAVQEAKAALLGCDHDDKNYKVMLLEIPEQTAYYQAFFRNIIISVGKRLGHEHDLDIVTRKLQELPSVICLRVTKDEAQAYAQALRQEGARVLVGTE